MRFKSNRALFADIFQNSSVQALHCHLNEARFSEDNQGAWELDSASWSRRWPLLSFVPYYYVLVEAAQQKI